MSIWLAVYLIGFAGSTGYGIGSCSGHNPACGIVAPVAGVLWPVLVPAAIIEDIRK